MGLTDAFRDAAQQRQERAFDALHNREEEENLRAWEQVAEIASQLELVKNGEARRAARQLKELAHAHVSISGELGFSVDDATFVSMPSGMISEAEENFCDELEEVSVPERLMVDRQKEAQAAAVNHVVPEMIDPPARPTEADIATFKHVCDGRDGRLCLFEDKDGHLVAVRASRLA